MSDFLCEMEKCFIYCIPLINQCLNSSSSAGQSESGEGAEEIVQRTSTPPVGGWANFGDFEKKQQSEEEAGGGGGEGEWSNVYHASVSGCHVE